MANIKSYDDELMLRFLLFLLLLLLLVLVVVVVIISRLLALVLHADNGSSAT